MYGMVSVKKWLPFCARQGQIPRWLRDANWHTRRLEDRRLRQISRRRFVTADPPPFIIRVSSREILPCCLPPFFSRLFARNRKSRDQSNERWTTNGETIDSVVKRGDHRSVAPIIIGLRRGWNPPFMLDRRRRLEKARKNGRFYDRRTKLDFYLFIFFFWFSWCDEFNCNCP